MLLTLDIGNSGVKYALFDEDSAPHHGRLSPLIMLADPPLAGNFTHVAMASVDPEMEKIIADMIKITPGVTLKKIPRDINVPIENVCVEPQNVGVDRLMNAVAAFDRHKTACVIVDAGTAVTVDAVDGEGRFLGGAILPCSKLMMEALYGGTALLPKISLGRPDSPIGNDTQPAIRSGVYYGVVGAINELTRRIDQEMGGGCRVVLTGGAGKVFRDDLARVDDYDELLTLRGIKITFERGERKKRRRR